MSPIWLSCGRGNGEAQFLLDDRPGLRRGHVLQAGAQDLADRPVKFHRFGDAHAVDFDADDVKAGAREEINHVAGPPGGETEVVRLDQDERPLGLVARRINHRVFDDAAVRIRVMGPQLGLHFSFLDVRGGEDGGLEVA